MSKPTFLIFPSGLTTADAQIGRIVSNPFAPHESYVPETPSIPENQVSVKVPTGVTNILDSMEEKTMKMSLMKLLEVSYATSSGAKTKFETLRAHTRVLRNAENELANILGEKSTQDWIKRKRGERLYLIVGIKIFEDASVSVERHSKETVNAPATVGVGASHPAPTRVRTGATRSHEDNLETSFKSGGETIFAVEYQELMNYKSMVRGYDFRKAELGYAATPSGGQGIYYAGGDRDERLVRGAAEGNNDDSDGTEFKLANEDFSPLICDEEIVVEEGEEIWLMRIVNETQ